MIEREPEQKNNTKQIPDIKLLLDTWRGKNNNLHSEKAIVGTCALALHLCNKANSQNDAIEMANEFWNTRNLTLI